MAALIGKSRNEAEDKTLCLTGRNKEQVDKKEGEFKRKRFR